MHIFGEVLRKCEQQVLPPINTCLKKLEKWLSAKKPKNQSKKTQPQEDGISTYSRLK